LPETLAQKAARLAAKVKARLTQSAPPAAPADGSDDPTAIPDWMLRERRLAAGREAREAQHENTSRAKVDAQIAKLAATLGLDIPKPAPPTGSAAAPRPPATSRKARRFIDRSQRAAALRSKGFDALERADARYLDRLRERYSAAGRETPPGMSRAAFLMSLDIRADGSGRAARTWLFRCLNKPLVGAIREAALVPDPETGVCRYDWRDARARAICATALVLHAHAKVTKRERGASWGLCVRGITLGALAAWLQDPFTRERPAHTTLNGRHRRDGTYRNGQVGWVRALAEAQALYAVQPPPEVCAPWEIWPAKPTANGGEFIPTTNQYWLRTPLPTLAMSHGELERLQALALMGCDAHTEEIARRPRRKPAPMAQPEPESQAPP